MTCQDCQDLKEKLKSELRAVEDEMEPLEDLGLQSRKWGRHQVLRAYHHTYTKVLKWLRDSTTL